LTKQTLGGIIEQTAGVETASGFAMPSANCDVQPGFYRWTVAFVSMRVNEGAWIIKRTVPLFSRICRIYSEYPMNSVPAAYCCGAARARARTHTRAHTHTNTARCLCLQTWRLSAECAVDMNESSGWGRHYSECMSVTKCECVSDLVRHWGHRRLSKRDTQCVCVTQRFSDCVIAWLGEWVWLRGISCTWVCVRYLVRH
jgi:hypothetical protein